MCHFWGESCHPRANAAAYCSPPSNNGVNSMKELTDMAKADSKNLSRATSRDGDSPLRLCCWWFMAVAVMAEARRTNRRARLQRRLHLQRQVRLCRTIWSASGRRPWVTSRPITPVLFHSTTDFIGSIAITVYFQSDGAYRFDLSTASRYFGGNCSALRSGASQAGQASRRRTLPSRRRTLPTSLRTPAANSNTSTPPRPVPQPTP